MNTSMGKAVNWTLVNKDVCEGIGGMLQGSGCGTTVYHDNVFFLSFILGVGTFGVAWTLVNMKQSTFFPTFVSYLLLSFTLETYSLKDSYCYHLMSVVVVNNVSKRISSDTT